MSNREIFERLSTLAAKGRCLRRQIGCIFTNQKGEIIAEGYNGTPLVMPSCQESPCPDALVPAGSGNAAFCYGLHAEERALLSMKQPISDLYAVYSTKAPCLNCVLKLLETNCQVIYFITPSNEGTNQELWTKAGRTWMQLSPYVASGGFCV